MSSNCHNGGRNFVLRGESHTTPDEIQHWPLWKFASWIVAQEQSYPGAKVCVCTEGCCNSGDGDCTCPAEDRHACLCTHPGAETVAVPSTGIYLVADGRIMKSLVDTQGYAGPQVHLIVTEEPWEGE